ncbi:MAG: DUF4954 family protein, partial [Muribaculaceae bacterium]|nr:DUF4954 family protein [Muribaculaceae bacterium]
MEPIYISPGAREIQLLEANGCRCNDWSRIKFHAQSDFSRLRNVCFEGDNRIGYLNDTEIIENVKLVNCTVADNVTIRNIGDRLENCKIHAHARIVNVGSIVFEEGSDCGVGTEVSVLDETGSRSVTIFPGLTAQIALLMAREPKWRENHLHPLLLEYFDKMTLFIGIGENAVIENCGQLTNVSVGRECVIKGALSLRNGMLINNAAPGRALTFIGAGVDAENFIVEDGRLDSGAIIRNCYIGQGASIEKGFTAHDSLFFANCTLENGEACAVFAGPYTVSMHKSTLLIGVQTSFMNAGSGTNQSNHMYKLGPVHWGILERGVKTSSSSYLMLGAKIGAFSLLMGSHKTHPDSSQFPFSYLFGDDRGATVVVPAVMLRSCGLLRDEQKWPARDRRLKRKLPLLDRVVFDVLNPITVEAMLTALDVIDDLLMRPADDDRFLRYRGMKFTRASLERARHLYELAIYKYLSLRISDGFPKKKGEDDISEWVDMAGLLIPRKYLELAMKQESIEDMREVFDDAFNNYPELEKEWIASRFGEHWHKPAEVIASYAQDFDHIIEEDRRRYLEDLSAQNEMLKL